MDFGVAINLSLAALFATINDVHFQYKLYNLDYDMLLEFPLNNGKIMSDPVLPPKASSKENLNCCSCSSESSPVPLNRRVTKLAAVETSVFIMKFLHELKGKRQ